MPDVLLALALYVILTMLNLSDTTYINAHFVLKVINSEECKTLFLGCPELDYRVMD
ncbi:hypothetical protein KC19_6G127000 [Ceratodon purpureus]|uniref:Uncharacterized protein n=1 Tax=Ceratodon purpureus TaxID=3225 RepID=A0A8T0HF92_CERPU|nr:hypothetical protein KC19_6G127000 [Ceratodon purpureus]